MNLFQKLILCLGIITMTYADDDQMTVKDIAEALISFGDDCEHKPEEEHVIEVVKNEREPQYVSKCFRHCLMSQFELLEEGSTTMDKEKTLDLMGSMFSDRKDDLGEIIDECNSKNEAITEKCENAHAHGMCMLDLMKERGFDIPELKDE
ncbi:odorant-binding protein 19b [Cochliomyia hominivorax]